MTSGRQPRKISFPRRPDEMPRPDLPADHNKNKKQSVFSTRMDTSLRDSFRKWVEAKGMSVREASEIAVAQIMQLSDGDLPADHEKSKEQSIFSTRMDKSLKDSFRRWVEIKNISLRGASEIAIEKIMELSDGDLINLRVERQKAINESIVASLRKG